MKFYYSSITSKAIIKLTTYIIILSSLLLFKCSHVAHDANVKEGVQASVMFIPTYKFDNQAAWSYFQGNLSYGKRFKSGRKFSTSLYLMADYDRNDKKYRYLPALDFYYQRKTCNPYSGIGFVAAIDPFIYYMCGNEWYNEDSTSFALSYQAGYGITKFLNFQIKSTWYLKHVHFGPMIEYRYTFMKTDRIENSSYHNNRAHFVFVGVTMGVH